MPTTRGSLASYFSGIAAKSLSAVEARPEQSNQHEFNGVVALKQLLGSARRTFNARFLWLSDDEEEALSCNNFATWYDARERHPTRSEYRLYFPSTQVTAKASDGDLLIVARMPDESLLILIAKSGSTAEAQMRWLFDLRVVQPNLFTVREIPAVEPVPGFAARFILDELGIDATPEAPDQLEILLKRFGASFPATIEFSEFARNSVPEVSAEGPDAALIAWMEREETLFRTLERHIVGVRLKAGFGSGEPDVDAFVKFSLSVQNRRKSRAGYALENHLQFIFQNLGIRHTRNAKTENNARPDFIFPAVREYNSPAFPQARLTMLGVKSTCKDRWRQILSEAARIRPKHLLTLEPGISENQTGEMQSKFVQLVLPKGLHPTFSRTQRAWLMGLEGFIDLVKSRQLTIGRRRAGG